MSLHNKIASEFEEFGGLLRCDKCGLEVPLNPNNIGHYLSTRWPKHCGYTMSWVTNRLLKLEREQAKGG